MCIRDRLKIEEAAAKRQASVDRGEEVIVGVNKFRSDEKNIVDILEVDNVAVRQNQIKRLEKLKNSRDTKIVNETLEKLRTGASSDSENLLSLAIDASRARATVGEISMAMEDVFGRHKADTRMLSGVYGAAFTDDIGFQKIQKEVNRFTENEGRRPRMLVVKMGQDGHDRGAKVIATAFADIGFDVDVGPLFQTPSEAVQDALDNDVHVIGISSQAAGHKTLAPKLVEELKQKGGSNIIVICGGVIPQQDYKFLYDCGVKAIFGPGTNIPEAAISILKLIEASKN